LSIVYSGNLNKARVAGTLKSTNALTKMVVMGRLLNIQQTKGGRKDESDQQWNPTWTLRASCGEPALDPATVPATGAPHLWLFVL